jgi:hypothetical protein
MRAAPQAVQCDGGGAEYAGISGKPGPHELRRALARHQNAGRQFATQRVEVEPQADAAADDDFFEIEKVDREGQGSTDRLGGALDDRRGLPAARGEIEHLPGVEIAEALFLCRARQGAASGHSFEAAAVAAAAERATLFDDEMADLAGRAAASEQFVAQ